MAKAYDMFAGEEPYNCTKRGTVVVGKDGRISFYQEQPMREGRHGDCLDVVGSHEVAAGQRSAAARELEEREAAARARPDGEARRPALRAASRGR